MTRLTRALRLAEENTLSAKHLRTLAIDAPAPQRQALLLDAARLDDLAARWRGEAVKESAKARRSCSLCPKRALPGGYECAEHDDELPAAALSASAPLTPGGVL